ncbi:hypothetical protein ACS0TY_016226 [Phlomoides rotata]
MLVAQSPISGHHQIHRPKSGRKPLQPTNSSPSPFNTSNNSKPKPKAVDRIEISETDTSNKENIAPIYSTPVKKESSVIESIDASLAEELSAIREKLERLRVEKEKTENMLREREMKLDLQMQEALQRGVMQKQLEIEVDRLYRLKEIKLSCLSISPLRSLREKENEKKIKQDQMKVEIRQERKEESGGQNPDSEVKIEN